MSRKFKYKVFNKSRFQIFLTHKIKMTISATGQFFSKVWTNQTSVKMVISNSLSISNNLAIFKVKTK